MVCRSDGEFEREMGRIDDYDVVIMDPWTWVSRRRRRGREDE